MLEADQVFTGGAFQGDDDSLAVMGTITPSQYSLKFETESFTLDLPTQYLQADLDEAGERAYFLHPNYPDWKIYTRELAILGHRSLQRFGLRVRLEELKNLQQNDPAKHNRRVLYALVSIVGCFLCLWLFSNPILGVIVNTLPTEWEQKVGHAAFKEMTEDFDLTSEPVLTNRIFLVSQRLNKGLPYGAPKFKFHVADTDDLNAFAFPDGQVIVMRGLLEEATPDELAGVLAHEMAHVLEKHGMRQIAQLIGPMFIVKYIFGGDSALAALTTGAAMVSGFEYSRSNERDADDKAWDILVTANIDPRALTAFFRKLRASEGKFSGGGSLLSTHPATEERIQLLETRWENSPKRSGFQPVQGGADPPKTEPKPKFKFPF